jgi:hypothetical protein
MKQNLKEKSATPFVHAFGSPSVHISGSGNRPYPVLKTLIQLFDTDLHAPIGLYFGDSVVERISQNDTDTRTLGQMVLSKLSKHLHFACISRSAYHMIIYYRLLLALENMRRKPKFLILPINMRSFSPQWHMNPLYQFEQEINILDTYISTPDVPIAPIHGMPDTSTISQEFDRIPVQYPLTSFSTIGDFRKIIDSVPETETQKANRLKQIFIFHYMHPLESRHPHLLILNETLRLLKHLNMMVLIYVTPINYQAGKKYVGANFLKSIKKNLNLVQQLFVINQRTTPILYQDYSTLLSSHYFFHDDNATEHLNEEGRKILSCKLTDSVLQMSPHFYP